MPATRRSIGISRHSKVAVFRKTRAATGYRGWSELAVLGAELEALESQQERPAFSDEVLVDLKNQIISAINAGQPQNVKKLLNGVV